MPKLPSLTSQDIIKILERNGFVLDRTKGSHYIYYHPEKKKRVVVPFHRADLPRGTVLEILKQAGLDKEQIK
ncbi:MAG: type II toxin-antitoxin system HicA family toxin [Proteobacteria bacterium]|nr:type II toxin-antitoxin system HicA family toxin [Pseudomonadota bacterium]